MAVMRVIKPLLTWEQQGERYWRGTRNDPNFPIGRPLQSYLVSLWQTDASKATCNQTDSRNGWEYTVTADSLEAALDEAKRQCEQHLLQRLNRKVIFLTNTHLDFSRQSLVELLSEKIVFVGPPKTSWKSDSISRLVRMGLSGVYEYFEGFEGSLAAEEIEIPTQ